MRTPHTNKIVKIKKMSKVRIPRAEMSRAIFSASLVAMILVSFKLLVKLVAEIGIARASKLPVLASDNSAAMTSAKCARWLKYAKATPAAAV